MLRLSAIALLSGGHILIEDLPRPGQDHPGAGIGKLHWAFVRSRSMRDPVTSSLGHTGLSIFNREEGSVQLYPRPYFQQYRAAGRDQLHALDPERHAGSDGRAAGHYRRGDIQIPDPFMEVLN